VPQILTVGHSTHTADLLGELLNGQQIQIVADVRSRPYSRFNPDANRETLAARLKARGLQYVFLGRELGARSEDPACYENGRVQYARLAESLPFKEGLARVIELGAAQRVALLCSEKEPLACHRTLLVARKLVDAGQPVAHLHSDGSLEAHTDAMSRLMRELRMPQNDLFVSREDLIAAACAEQEKRIAYVDKRTRVG
jgi:uncharacterized protein (DUF488 family)